MNGTVPGLRTARIIEFNRNLRYGLNFEFESGSNKKSEKFQIRIHRTAIQTSIHYISKKLDKKATDKWGNVVTFVWTPVH
jgi:hypothetical protein